MSMIEDAMTVQPAGIWVAGRRMLTVGLTLIIIATAFEMLAVAATMPATAQDLGGLAWYGWAFSAFMLANMVAATVAGPEADRRGIATPFIAGTFLFVGGLLIAGLAPTMPLLIVGRAVQGLGSGIIGAVVYIIVGRGYEADARPRMLALISSAWVVPGMVGPALAGIIVAHAGWRWVFLGLIPLPILAACMALPSLRRLAPAQHSTSDTRQRNREIRLALVLATGAGMVISGLGWISAAPLKGAALLAFGAVATIIALRQVLPAGTLRAAPGLPAAIAAMGAAQPGILRRRCVRPAGAHDCTWIEHRHCRAGVDRCHPDVDCRRMDAGASRQTYASWLDCCPRLAGDADRHKRHNGDGCSSDASAPQHWYVGCRRMRHWSGILRSFPCHASECNAGSRGPCIISVADCQSTWNSTRRRHWRRYHWLRRKRRNRCSRTRHAALRTDDRHHRHRRSDRVARGTVKTRGGTRSRWSSVPQCGDEGVITVPRVIRRYGRSPC
jgi:MFS family permease